MIVVAAAAASYNDSSGVFENSSGVFDNSSAVFDALPLPSDTIHDDAPVPATYAASDELIKLMKAKPNHVDAMRHLLGTAVNKTSDDGSGRRRSSDAPAFAYDDGVRLQELTVLQVTCRRCHHHHAPTTNTTTATSGARRGPRQGRGFPPRRRV